VNGTVKFLTKGDNNSVDDRGLYAPGQLWLTKKDVVGRARGFLPYVGMVTIYMNEYPKFKVSEGTRGDVHLNSNSQLQERLTFFILVVDTFSSELRGYAAHAVNIVTIHFLPVGFMTEKSTITHHLKIA
jgi:hypothetical protein